MLKPPGSYTSPNGTHVTHGPVLILQGFRVQETVTDGPFGHREVAWIHTMDRKRVVAHFDPAASIICHYRDRGCDHHPDIALEDLLHLARQTWPTR